MALPPLGHRPGMQRVAGKSTVQSIGFNLHSSSPVNKMG